MIVVQLMVIDVIEMFLWIVCFFCDEDKVDVIVLGCVGFGFYCILFQNKLGLLVIDFVQVGVLFVVYYFDMVYGR